MLGDLRRAAYAPIVTARPRLCLFLRYPTPGRAKTRLIPALGPAGAAAVHRRLVDHTLAAVAGAAADVELWTTGASTKAFLRWLGGDYGVVAQGRGTLGTRLARAAAQPPVLLLGCDIPDLAPDHIDAALAALSAGRFAVGPAEDGGYYLLALPRPCPALFRGIDWGTAEVLAQTEAAAARAGVALDRLEMLADLDRPEDLERWPWLQP